MYFVLLLFCLFGWLVGWLVVVLFCLVFCVCVCVRVRFVYFPYIIEKRRQACVNCCVCTY